MANDSMTADNACDVLSQSTDLAVKLSKFVVTEAKAMGAPPSLAVIALCMATASTAVLHAPNESRDQVRDTIVSLVDKFLRHYTNWTADNG